MKRIVIMLALSAAASAAHAAEADWKVYGFSTVNDQDVALFYSNHDIRRLSNGNIEFWTKGLSQSELGKRVSDPEFAKAPAIERAAKKIAESYIPPVTLANSLPQDQVTALVVLEEVANDAEIEPASRSLYELNCGDRVMRVLSSQIKIDGKVQSDDIAGVWRHIAPETNGATLMVALCPASKDKKSR